MYKAEKLMLHNTLKHTKTQTYYSLFKEAVCWFSNIFDMKSLLILHNVCY
jgi:hypothetical protein